MIEDRLEKLMEMQLKHPDDPFFPYGIALEHQNSGNKLLAAELFFKITLDFPEYLPTFHQLGMLLNDLGRRDDSISILRQGKELAIVQKENKTYREINAYLEELLDEDY